jgi:hypothetical protein
MADDTERRGGSLLDWVKGLGLPIASLIASAAFFGVQMQQQAFQQVLNNVENGYRFYFEKRTDLSTAADVETEQAMLVMVGRVFPNIYCNVRADMYGRVSTMEPASDASAGGDAFTAADRDFMLAFLVNKREPESPELRTQFASLLPWSPEPRPTICTSEFDVEREQVVAPPAETAPTPSTSTAPVVAEAPDGTTPTEAAPSRDAQAGTQAGIQPGIQPGAPARSERVAASVRAETGLRTQAAREVLELALSPRAQTYQVFFHLREGVRTPDVVNPLRAPLARANFRVMRNVALIAPSNFPRNPQVRYFGPDQEQAATELAAFLSAQYQNEGLRFETNAIGDSNPNMPPSHLEVWLP